MAFDIPLPVIGLMAVSAICILCLLRVSLRRE